MYSYPTGRRHGDEDFKERWNPTQESERRGQTEKRKKNETTPKARNNDVQHHHQQQQQQRAISRNCRARTQLKTTHSHKKKTRVVGGGGH